MKGTGSHETSAGTRARRRRPGAVTPQRAVPPSLGGEHDCPRPGVAARPGARAGGMCLADPGSAFGSARCVSAELTVMNFRGWELPYQATRSSKRGVRIAWFLERVASLQVRKENRSMLGTWVGDVRPAAPHRVRQMLALRLPTGQQSWRAQG